MGGNVVIIAISWFGLELGPAGVPDPASRADVGASGDWGGVRPPRLASEQVSGSTDHRLRVPQIEGLRWEPKV